MADATVLTPEQIQQLLAAQQQQSASTSSSAPAPTNRLKTSFRKRRSFEPFYTGGATAITPDGSTLFATLNEQVTVVHVNSGSIVQRIEGDTEEITALAVTPSGSHLVVASRSLALSVYSLPECKLVRTMAKSHTSQVNLIKVDPTGTLLATGGADGVAKVWDLEGGFVTHVFKGHAGVVSALAWNMPPIEAAKPKKGKKGNNGRVIQLLTGSVDGKVRVWDLNNQSEVHKPAAVLAGHDSVVRGIAITPDGNTVVTGSRDRTLVIWKLSGAGWKQAETLSANEGIESVGFVSPTTFFTGGSNGNLRLWSLSNNSIIAIEPRSFNEAISPAKDDEETRAITDVHFLAATSTLVSVHADQNIVFRSVADESLRKVRQMVGFNDEIVDLALTSAKEGGEETHLAVATNSRSLRMYSLANEEEGTTVELLPGHEDIVLCLDRSPDGRLLASGAKDKSVRIWAFVPASRLTSLAAASDDAGKTVSRSSAIIASSEDEGEWVCVAICTGHAESVGAIAFARRPSAPGAAFAPFIVSASQDRTVKIWDLSPVNTLLSSSKPLGRPIQLKSLTTQRVHEKDINCLDVSPNNSMVATGSQDRTAKIFQLSFTAPSSSNSAASARLTTLATLKGHKRGIWACRFSPTDLALATASGDKSIRIWSLKDYSSVKLFQGHTNSVLKLGFLSSGMQLVSCAGDGLVKVWNVKDEECATTVDAHDDKVWSIVVAKKEGWFVSAAADGTVGVWEDSTEEEEERKREEREKEVEMEQEFGNMLTRKDWRNAISLALQMGQPRRLLNLFRVVQDSRPEASGGGGGGLLEDVLGEDSDDELELGDDGEVVNGKPHRRGRAARKDATTAADADATSITGLVSVDQIIATLPAAHLIQLLLYIRDWNTSTRTSPIAQTLLHAILTFHTASSLISIFSSSLKTHREALAERLENEELGIIAAASDKQRAQQKRADREKNVDLDTLVEGLLPYTERHWLRADRTLIEASMLEYSVEAMDTLLGGEEVEEEEAQTFGEQLTEEASEEEDVEMDDDESD